MDNANLSSPTGRASHSHSARPGLDFVGGPGGADSELVGSTSSRPAGFTAVKAMAPSPAKTTHDASSGSGPSSFGNRRISSGQYNVPPPIRFTAPPQRKKPTWSSVIKDGPNLAGRLPPIPATTRRINMDTFKRTPTTSAFPSNFPSFGSTPSSPGTTHRLFAWSQQSLSLLTHLTRAIFSRLPLRRFRLILYILLSGLTFTLIKGFILPPDVLSLNGMTGGGSRVGALWKIRQTVGDGDHEEDDGGCQFVSVIEAYEMDVARLRSTMSNGRRGAPTNLTRSTSKRPPHTRLPQHTYSPTGHLILSKDPKAPHPIPQLLQLGEKRWEEMLDRQSRTLEEAVEEYRRRYGRRPPSGFDVWWEFASAIRLVLPDEYDRIHLDLAPFWALPRPEMHKRLAEASKLKETYTLVIKDGRVDIEIDDEGGLEWGGTMLRAIDCASLIKGFSRHLPDMRAVFSIHDQPQVYLSHARRSSLIELGLKGQHTTHLAESDDAHVKWSRSCSAESNLRTRPGLDESESLVYDTLEAMDLCQNPYMMDLHGMTLEPHGPTSHPRPHTSLIPVFSLAKTSVNSDILITPLDQFMSSAGNDPPWAEKRDQRVVWRGSTTGISWMDRTTPWRKAHRSRLHAFAQNVSEDVISFKAPVLSEDGGPLLMQDEAHPTVDIAEFFYDMQLAGEPLQCDERDGTCDQMRDEFDFAPYQDSEELNNHKFMFDIDGNGWSGRFRRLMSTNSAVLKTGLFTEWFQPHLIPWFMYIPTRLDYSDLPLILGFLRGTPDKPDQGFDEVSKAIARNGQCFVQRMFRVQDLQAYMFRLLLEYARLTADSDADTDFSLEDELEDEHGDDGGLGGIDAREAVDDMETLGGDESWGARAAAERERVRLVMYEPVEEREGMVDDGPE